MRLGDSAEDRLRAHYYRTIKNKSPKQNADMAEIERIYRLAVKAGGGDE